ncbi:MAG: hypothetical protein ABWX84_12405 [Nocardioides sp.]
MTSDYRLSPLLAARLLGASLVVFGLLVFLATAVVVLFSAPVLILTITVCACVVGVFATGWFLTRKAYVVHLDEEGYHVRYVRGAGVDRARWADVEDAVTTTVAGSRCVVLRLRDGRSTTIPVDVLVGDRDEFVQQVLAYLNRRGPRTR